MHKLYIAYIMYRIFNKLSNEKLSQYIGNNDIIITQPTFATIVSKIMGNLLNYAGRWLYSNSISNETIPVTKWTFSIKIMHFDVLPKGVPVLEDDCTLFHAM